MNIYYKNKKIKNGELLDREMTLKEPCIDLLVSEKIYTIIMYDPDAPNGYLNPKDNFNYLHWIVSNIKYKNNKFIHANIIAIYSPPSPPRGTHRYYLKLYEQSEELPDDTYRGHRDHFDLESYIKKNHLIEISSTHFFQKSVIKKDK